MDRTHRLNLDASPRSHGETSGHLHQTVPVLGMPQAVKSAQPLELVGEPDWY